MRLVLLRLGAVIMYGWLSVRAFGNSVRQDPQRTGNREAAAVAKFHQPGKAERILITRACSVQMSVEILDSLKHQMDEALLFEV